MGQVVLLQALPIAPATGATVAVRLAGGGSRPYTGHLGFSDWRSGLNGLPRFTTELGFDQGGWTGGAVPQTAVVRFQGTDKALTSTLAALFWKGARIVITSGDDTFGAPTSWKTEMTGTVADVSIRAGVLQLTISDLSGDLAKTIVPDTFAGTGGIEGADDATGRVKRRSWGRVFNIEGRLIDKANNVYEFGDPSRQLQAFDMLKDKGRAGDMTVLAWQGSVAATFAALQTSTCPPGGGVVAPSIAMAKWWTVPSGPLTADLRGETAGGYIETPTGIASRIVAARSTINPVFTLNASRAYPAGIHADDPAETVANVLDRLLLPVSLAWSLSPAGTITVDAWNWDTPVESLVSQDVARETVFSPLSTRKLGFQKNQRVQGDGEISAVLLAATDVTYADGTPIEVLKPAQGGADVTARNTASGIVGQGPGATAPGADVLNGGITIGADGSLSGAGGGQVTYPGIGGKALGLLDQLFFGSPYLTESAGGASATLNAFKTALGIASGFSGQGSLATLSSLSYGGQYLTGFGGFAGISELFFGSPLLRETSGGASATLSGFKTILGIASAISGQAPAATDGTIQAGATRDVATTGREEINDQPSYYFQNFAGRTVVEAKKATFLGITGTLFTEMGTLRTIVGAAVRQSFLEYATGRTWERTHTDFVNWSRWSQVYNQDRRPAFGGADLIESPGGPDATLDGFKTILGNAAGFAGQGRLATQSYVKLGPPSDAFPGFAFLINESNGYYVSDAAAITSQGTAAAFSGQTAWATFATSTSVVQKLRSDGALSLGVNGGLASENFGEWVTNASAITRFGTAAAITGQGYGATASRDLVDNTYTAKGANVLPNSDQTGACTWILYGSNLDMVMNFGPVKANTIWGIDSYALAGRTNNIAAYQSNVVGSTAAYRDYVLADADSRIIEIGCAPGEKWICSCYIATHRCPSEMYVTIMTPDGTILAYASGGQQPSTERNTNIMGEPNYRRHKVAFSIPEGGTRMRLTVRKLDTYAANANSYIWWAAPMLERAGANQTEPSPYVPGPPSSTRDIGYTGDYDANNTGRNTAAAIAGQSKFATKASITDGDISGYLEERIAPFSGDARYLAAGRVAWAAGNVVEALKPEEAGGNRTETRTSAAIAGQGQLATRSNIRLGGPNDPGFNNGAWAHLINQNNTYYVTDSVAITSQGTSAAFAGQGALATANTINNDGQLGGLVGNRLIGSPADANYLNADRMAWNEGATVQALKPGERGANVTENRTSAAIVGQSGFATAAGIGRDTIFSAGFFNYNAFSLGYTVTRSDGVSTVTEQLVVTQVGVAAGFAGQGALASKNNAGYNELDVSTLTAQTSDKKDGPYGGDFNTPIAYVPDFGKDLPVKPGGTIYMAFSGSSTTTNSGAMDVYNSIELLDAANNAVLASIRLPFSAQGNPVFTNHIIMIPNSWGYRTIRWRLAWRGRSGAAASQFNNPEMTVQWKAL